MEIVVFSITLDSKIKLTIMIYLLAINLLTILLNIVILLLVLAIVWLIIYAINRITPGFIDVNLARIIILIAFLILLLYWITGHTLVFWQ
jgi:hypothetical protein